MVKDHLFKNVIFNKNILVLVDHLLLKTMFVLFPHSLSVFALLTDERA